METDLNLLNKIASHFYKKNLNSILDFEDYAQEAYLALLESKLKYDPCKGPWANYLTKSVLNRLSAYASANNTLLRATKNAVKTSGQIHNLERAGLSKDDIIAKLDITEKYYNNTKGLLTK